MTKKQPIQEHSCSELILKGKCRHGFMLKPISNYGKGLVETILKQQKKYVRILIKEELIKLAKKTKSK